MTPAHSRADLSEFAAALAARLPGTWTSTYNRHATYADQFPVEDELWDCGHVQHIVSAYVLTHDAVLHGPEGLRLYVADRPLHRHQFVVAPLGPLGAHLTHHDFDGVEEPNGIVVERNPARAASDVSRRLLPRYRQAHQSVLNSARTAPPRAIQGRTGPSTASAASPPAATMPQAPAPAATAMAARHR